MYNSKQLLRKATFPLTLFALSLAGGCGGEEAPGGLDNDRADIFLEEGDDCTLGLQCAGDLVCRPDYNKMSLVQTDWYIFDEDTLSCLPRGEEGDYCLADWHCADSGPYGPVLDCHYGVNSSGEETGFGRCYY